MILAGVSTWYFNNFHLFLFFPFFQTLNFLYLPVREKFLREHGIYTESIDDMSTFHPSMISLADSQNSSLFQPNHKNLFQGSGVSFWSITSGDGYETGRERWTSGEGWTSSYYSVTEGAESTATTLRSNSRSSRNSNYSSNSSENNRRKMIRAQIPNLPKAIVSSEIKPPSRSSSLYSSSSNSSSIFLLK